MRVVAEGDLEDVLQTGEANQGLRLEGMHRAKRLERFRRYVDRAPERMRNDAVLDRLLPRLGDRGSRRAVERVGVEGEARAKERIVERWLQPSAGLAVAESVGDGREHDRPRVPPRLPRE